MSRIKGINKAEFKRKLKQKTGCAIQHNGWTCGTCFFTISKTLTNEHWRAVLFYRGDYTLKDVEREEEWDYEKLIKEVWEFIK